VEWAPAACAKLLDFVPSRIWRRLFFAIPTDPPLFFHFLLLICRRLDREDWYATIPSLRKYPPGPQTPVPPYWELVIRSPGFFCFAPIPLYRPREPPSARPDGFCDPSEKTDFFGDLSFSQLPLLFPAARALLFSSPFKPPISVRL